MMGKINRRTIESIDEEKIIKGLILDDSFSRKIIQSLRKDYFENESAALIFTWCKDYFSKYKQAPKKDIKHIFNQYRKELDEDKEEIVSSYIKEVIEQENESFNADYYVDSALMYIRKKSLDVSSSNIQKYLEAGKIEKAEQEMQSYRRNYKSTSSWSDPFDKDFITSTLLDEEEGTDQIFKFPGKLGEMSGWNERSWLVSVLAPMKRGKSFVLQEIAVIAAMNRKKVAYFSLEMSKKRVEKRILRRITAFGKESKEYLYPCFDCLKNQDGSCGKKERINKFSLLSADGIKPKFDRALKYRPCVECRGKNNDSYEVATWFTVKQREKLSIKAAVRKAKSIKNMFGDNFRIISYPANSVNIAAVKVDLEALEYSENFVADCVIIDYADILKPEDSRLVGRERTNETWSTMKGLSDEKHILVVTATQGTRKSIDKKSMEATDTSEDIRKFAHIDMMYAISQTKQEKREGVMRISVVGARDEDFDEFRQCLVLQNRTLGQVLLDSEIIKTKSDMIDAELEFGLE
jgi:hypothetical protein